MFKPFVVWVVWGRNSFLQDLFCLLFRYLSRDVRNKFETEALPPIFANKIFARWLLLYRSHTSRRTTPVYTEIVQRSTHFGTEPKGTDIKIVCNAIQEQTLTHNRVESCTFLYTHYYLRSGIAPNIAVIESVNRIREIPRGAVASTVYHVKLVVGVCDPFQVDL